MLAAAMLFSSAAVVSYAQEDEEMKAALTVVKERITVPEKLTEFTHRVSTVYGKKTYSFQWSSPDGNASLEAEVCGKVITGYGYSDFSGDLPENNGETKPYTFAKLTKEELIRKAEKAIEKLNPTIAEKLSVSGDGVRISLYGESATVPIVRVENGVKVAGQKGAVSLNKNTGELTRFDLSWIPGAGFGDSEKAIKKSEAEKSYQTEFPVELRYVAEYDWKTDEYTPHLIFRRAGYGQIDAFTGKKATFEESYDYYKEMGADEVLATADDADMETENAAAGGVSFTEQEIAKMELEGKLIKPEQKLAEMIGSGIWSIPSDAEVSGFHTYFDQRSGTYLTRASLRVEEQYVSIDEMDFPEPLEEYARSEPVVRTYYGSVSYNAETGEIRSFYGSDSQGGKTLKSEKEAKKLLNRYFGQIAGDKAKEFKLESPDFGIANLDKNGNRTESSYIDSASVSSPRYAFEIPCEPESASISLDASGRVSGYNMNYLGLDYPKPENILDTDEVYKKYFGQVGYELLYRAAYNTKKKRVETALVYNADKELYIDAFSGALTSSNGETAAQNPGGYTDLDGSGLREAAEKLALYGITLMDEKGRLNEEKTITREDFSNLVRSIGIYYGTDKNGGKALTRKFAAKILTAQYSDIAELPGLFSSAFSDVPKSDKYAGYIAIAAAKGYMKGEKGKFRPSEKMTRGEALMLVYDYLSR